MTVSWPDRIIEAGVLVLLVVTPLAFGTVEPWSEALAELVILGMAVTYVVRNLREWEFRVDLPPGRLPAALFLALITLQAAVPGWSLDQHATRRAAVKLLAVAAFFLLCYNTYRTRAQIRRALWTMIGTGTLIALFGIVQRMTWNGRLYWVGPESPTDSAFGPFVNRTHFAGLMVVVLPAALAFILARRRGAQPAYGSTPRWRDRLRAWNSESRDATSLLPLLVLVMGGAALVSGSRGGAVALLVTLVAMTLGFLASGKRSRFRAARLLLAAVLIVLTASWIGSDVLYGTVERLAEEVRRPGESLRVRVWGDALVLWSQFPLRGTGLDTFGVAFPAVRTVQAPVVFEHAESDWIQLLTDTGALGLLLAVTAVGAVARALLRRRPQGLALAGLVALLGTVVQGIGNYNLPIMSNLIYLGLMVVLALKADRELSWDGRRGDAPRGDAARLESRSEPRGSPPEIASSPPVVARAAGGVQRSSQIDAARSSTA